MLKKYLFTLITSLILYSASAFCAENPIALMETLTKNVMQEIEKQKSKGALNVRYVANSMIMPNVEFEEVAKWVAGRNAWNEAADSDKKLLIKALRGLLLNTYVNSLEKCSNQTVTFLPPRRDISNKKRIMVYSLISNGKEEFRLDYRLMLVEDKWKIYDLIIEGVSLLKGYQSQFYTDIKQNGIQKVAKQIISHNESL